LLWPVALAEHVALAPQALRRIQVPRLTQIEPRAAMCDAVIFKT
jgi:hypothetical protein